MTGSASSVSFDLARPSSRKAGPFSLAEVSQMVLFAITGDPCAADPALLVFVEDKLFQEISERYVGLWR